MKATLADHRTAPLRAGVKAVMHLLDKVADPSAPEISADDIQAARDAGVSDEAIRHALHVCAIFMVLSRLADALGWRVPQMEEFQRAAKFLVPHGYAMPRPLAWITRARSLFA